MNETARRLFIPLASILDRKDAGKSAEEFFGPPADEPIASDDSADSNPFTVNFFV
jgi:hypothetical protein